MIESEIKKQFGSWAAFRLKFGHDKSNFKRKINQNISRLNKWLEPLNLEVKIVEKSHDVDVSL